MNNYPAEMPIRIINTPLNHFTRVPSSKSITIRAMILGALYCDKCYLRCPLISEDTNVMVDSLRRLGWLVDVHAPDFITISRPQKIWPSDHVRLFLENSGTSMRFLTALVATGRGTFTLDGTARMRERPIGDLLDALRQLGIETVSNNGCPPVTVKAKWLEGGSATLKSDFSSQYLSAILMAAPRAKMPTTLTPTGTAVSEPYIDMTLAMMEHWGLKVSRTGQRIDIETKKDSLPEMEYAIEPDASAASYFFAAAAIAGGCITVSEMKCDMLQGDVRFVEILERMGCQVEYLPDGIRVSCDLSGRSLAGVDVDMNDISDTVMTLASVACFADSPTTIRNVAHIRYKECDRIAATCRDLRKLGVEVEEYSDGMRITPRPMIGCALDTYNDHRMAMSLALIGFKVPGVVIRNPGCVAKTYPGFWDDFAKLYDSAS